MEAMKMNGNGKAGFRAFGLHPKLMRAIEDLEFESATPVQIDAIPPGLEGRDVLA